MKLSNITARLREALAGLLAQNVGGKHIAELAAATKALEPVDLKWVEHLHEVGSPIRHEARKLMDTRRALEDNFNRMSSELDDKVGALMKDVAQLWSPKEIGQAINRAEEARENPKI